MIAIQVMGNDAAIGFAGSQGNFELNVLKPLMIYNLLNSITLLKESCQMFEKYCIQGLEANRNKIQDYVKNSFMLVTALSPIIGYDKCAQIAHKAYVEEMSIRDACLALQFLSGTEFDKNIDPVKMTRP